MANDPPEPDVGTVRRVEGKRVYTRHAPGYFRSEVDGARRLAGLDGT